jgi:hypothetical protein
MFHMALYTSPRLIGVSVRAGTPGWGVDVGSSATTCGWGVGVDSSATSGSGSCSPPRLLHHLVDLLRLLLAGGVVPQLARLHKPEDHEPHDDDELDHEDQVLAAVHKQDGQPDQGKRRRRGRSLAIVPVLRGRVVHAPRGARETSSVSDQTRSFPLYAMRHAPRAASANTKAPRTGVGKYALIDPRTQPVLAWSPRPAPRRG